jgi:hypothetical protein
MESDEPICREGSRLVRYPEGKIKEAILHPDLEIRDRAIGYFSDSYSPDPSVMGQVIRAVETYGREDAYRIVGAARELRQTGESVDWVISELNDERSNDYENYAYNLSMVLLGADPALLVPRESAILESRHFLPELRPAFTERLRMLPWDAATGWRALEDFCERGKAKRYTNEVNLGHARRIVEALARHGEECAERVRTVLASRIEGDEDTPMAWMEPLVARLAGQAHLDSTIPLLVAKLREDGGDVLNEECAEALARIGTPEVLHAVAAAFPGAEDHFRIYSIKPLEAIHSDLAVETCLRLLDREKDERVQMRLAEALLAQFAEEGVEIARRLLLGRELDFDSRDLWDSLLRYCTLTGARFPEYDEWLARDRRDKEEHRKKVKELESDPARLMLYAFEKLAGKKASESDVPSPRPRVALSTSPRLLPTAPRSKQKIGRNERCPCGSGKKFKHCCGRG